MAMPKQQQKSRINMQDLWQTVRQKGTYLVMGTISAVNIIIEGMTPVTNMDDSIHGTF